MTMMFSLLGGTISLWEIGNKRIEAAQTARVGLNIIANDLRRAISDQQVSYTTSGTAITNTIPFWATNNATTTIDLGGGAANAAGSAQLFGVLATGKTNQPFEEFGYLCAYLTKSDADNYMVSNKYYLVRKSSTTTNNANFYLRDNANTEFADKSDALFPIIENCVRLEFSYPVTNASGGIDFTNTWNSQTNLPLGVLVSVWVLDSRTADKIADISPYALFSIQINSITNATPSTDPVDRLLQRGAVRMRRFIPLNQH
jgi:hypothetical protein